VLCFVCAFISSLLGAESASADTPPTAIKSTPLAAPAAVLGITNPYLIAAATKTPEILGFTLSQDIRDLALRVEKLARYGVDLNQRKITHTEKLQLRVDTRTRGVGGILKICYRH
jgi:predicted LPLAT superfamily acyltransferase